MGDRLREFLGVWMPMALGLLLIAVAVNFLAFPPASPPREPFALDPLASLGCGILLAAFGGLLTLSTYGRWRKVRATRRGPSP